MKVQNLDRYIKAHIENQKLVPQCRIIKFNGAVSFELPVDTALRQGYSLSSDISPCEVRMGICIAALHVHESRSTHVKILWQFFVHLPNDSKICMLLPKH